MTSEVEELVKLVRSVSAEAVLLRDKYVQSPSNISYCCIFTQNDEEQARLDRVCSGLGNLANATPTGNVYVVPSIKTDAGELRVIKVRAPDSTRPERGDADFALADYVEHQADILELPNSKLIVRDEFEMIELIDSNFDVRVYFSHPPVELHGGIREALAKLP